ncbi:MAG: hypothetical protein N2037_02590 [Acidimicrobiales bacterium]|nr:hypothetical protein [Acidimicrobiales bacterium]
MSSPVDPEEAVRRLFVPVLLLVASLLILGCAAKKPSLTASGTLPALPPGPSTTSTTAPPSTVKNTPECGAMYRFSLSQVSTANAKKEKQAEALAAAEKTAAAAKQSVPLLTAAIDTTVELLKKSLAGPLGDDDKQRSRNASQEIDQWWKANCV